MKQTFFSMFIAGLSFGCGPCLASCGPLLVSYVAGTRRGVFGGMAAYLWFSLSRLAAYAALGVAAFFLGNFLRTASGVYARFILIAGGVYIVALGVRVIIGRAGKGAHSAALMGLAIGLAPCAPLAAVLSYIGLAAQNWLQGFLSGLAFGIGTLVSPLVVIAGAAGLISRWMKDQPPVFSRFVNWLCGLIIIALGAQLILRACGEYHV